MSKHKNTTNIDTCSIFKEDCPHKIKFLSKMCCEFQTEVKDRLTQCDAYFLECHGEKYILEFEKQQIKFWDILIQSITIRKSEDFFNDVNSLKKCFTYGTVKFFTGQDRHLEKNKNYSPYEIDFKEFFINADVNSSDFGIHEYERLKEIDYIDFTILLSTGTTKVNDYVNEFFKNVPTEEYLPRPAFVLKDGTTISIQASAFTYCSPRVNNAEKYNEVEVGFPSKEFPELLPFAEDAECPTGTIYAYVPVDILNKIIEREGLHPEFYNKYFKGEYIRGR